MTGTIRNVHVQMLCTLAEGDESTLQYPLPDYIFGFHTQQSCEKLMKALISSHNRKYPFTHVLKELLQILADCGEVLPSLPFPWKRLEPFSVKLRYDFSTNLTESDRTAMRETVVLLRQHVVARILALEQQP